MLCTSGSWLSLDRNLVLRLRFYKVWAGRAVLAASSSFCPPVLSLEDVRHCVSVIFISTSPAPCKTMRHLKHSYKNRSFSSLSRIAPCFEEIIQFCITFGFRITVPCCIISAVLYVQSVATSQRTVFHVTNITKCCINFVSVPCVLHSRAISFSFVAKSTNDEAFRYPVFLWSPVTSSPIGRNILVGTFGNMPGRYCHTI